MSYSIRNGLAYGNVPLSISDIVEELPDFFCNLGMLITCVDSSNTVTTTLEIGHELFAGSAPCGDALWFQASAVEKFLKQGWIFDGFEEVYLVANFEQQIRSADEKYTSEAFDFAKSVPETFIQRFGEFKAERFLADGCGLNFACEPHFAEKIERLDRG